MTRERNVRFVAIDRMDLFREVLKRIEDYIEANDLKPGDRLPGDRDLAASLGVSRPLVRQAIKVLEGLGRVSAQQGSGTYVRDDKLRVAAQELTRGLDFVPELLQQLVPVRIAIEVEVMRAAATRRTKEMLTELADHLAERDAQLEDDLQEASLDLGFEAVLGRNCGNEILYRLQALIHEVWLQCQISTGMAPEDRFQLHGEHRSIYEAFQSGDMERATNLVASHIAALARKSRPS